jgi:transcriptional regulator with XRE-family HTH domain
MMRIDRTKVRDLREDIGLSQRELAKKAGLGHNTIYRIESGQEEVWPRTARQLAAGLGVTVKELRAGKPGTPK